MTKQSFIVMDKLGKSLHHYLKAFNFQFSLATVCKLGIRLLHILEALHDVGLVYNDLKPENVMIGDAWSSQNSLSDVRVVDFGFCSEYLDSKGDHIMNTKK